MAGSAGVDSSRTRSPFGEGRPLQGLAKAQSVPQQQQEADRGSAGTGAQEVLLSFQPEVRRTPRTSLTALQSLLRPMR